MSEIEMAQEGIEHAAHEHAHGGVPHAKKAAIVIAALAACLAICETAAKDAQTAVLTHHIAASDTWAQYQGKVGRRTTFSTAADILSSLPDASDPAVAKRIADTVANAERIRSEPGKDGMDQLAALAHDQEHVRDRFCQHSRQRVWAWSDIQPLRGHAASRMASTVADLRRN
jgi:hypothetical protein